MANRDDVPAFRQGEQLSAKKLEALAAPLRQSRAGPGSFQSGNEDLQRRIGGGSGASNIRKARVTTLIPEASSAAFAGWSTTGEVDICDETTGLPTGTSVSVDSEQPVEYIIDAVVWVDVAYSPPRVVNGTCDAQDAETFWGD